MANSEWPRGTGTQAARPPTPATWERPDPPRLNDTSALVRKGIHPYELLLRGQDTVATSGRWTSPLETAWNPEHTFDKRGVSTLAGSPPQGCGTVVSIKSPARNRNGRSVDGNGTVPRTGNLAGAVAECEKC